MKVIVAFVRWGVKYGVGGELKDSLAESLIDQNPTGEVTPMGSQSGFATLSEQTSPETVLTPLFSLLCVLVTAENLAQKYGITRQECDGQPRPRCLFPNPPTH